MKSNKGISPNKETLSFLVYLSPASVPSNNNPGNTTTVKNVFPTFQKVFSV